MKARYIMAALAMLSLAAMPAQAKKMSDLKIYINPGHGGYTSNDRNIKIYPFALGDSMGYWESKSNLYKGLHLYHILDSLGTKPMLSRIKNTEADDRNLTSISNEANNFGADLFFSIHSNAGENVNYLLMLYRENAVGTPRYPENVTLSNILADNMQTNEMSNWTRKPWISGDLTFYPQWGSSGLGVLRHLYVPGLLSEGGMHEHRPQAYRLMNDDYWWLEAWHFAHAIMDYYDVEDRFVTGNVAGVVYDDHNLREMDIPNCTFTMIGVDKLAPVCGCFIELIDKNGKTIQTRTTDNLFNGVFVFRNVTPGDYTVRFTKDTYYTVERPVTVEADKVSYINTPLNMKREYPLEIVKYGPVSSDADGLVICSAPIEFEFNCDVDVEAFTEAFSITPAVSGYWKFTENNHKAKFTYDSSLEPDVEYTVRVAETAKTPDKTYSHPGLTQPFEFKFKTRNRDRLAVTETFPTDGGSVHFSAPYLEVRFDNKIRSTGMADLLKITDSKGNVIPFNARATSYNTVGNGFGNAVYALQADLTVGETYNFFLSKDLRDNDQLPMSDDLKFSFTAIDATANVPENAEIVETFENANVLAGELESSTGLNVKPTVARSTTPHLFGEAALKLGYTFAETHDGNAVWRFNEASPISFETGDRVGMFVNGDFSGHALYVGVTSGTDTKWHKLCDLDFRGWEYRDVELTELEAGYTYILDMLRIEQVENPMTQKGAIVVDDMTRLVGEREGVSTINSDVANGMKVYPVPADDAINVEIDANIKCLQLINAVGVTVASEQGANSINVSDVTAGTYLLRVITDQGLVTRRVAVKH